jgi:hypothetical protein
MAGALIRHQCLLDRRRALECSVPTAIFHYVIAEWRLDLTRRILYEVEPIPPENHEIQDICPKQ